MSAYLMFMKLYEVPIKIDLNKHIPWAKQADENRLGPIRLVGKMLMIIYCERKILLLSSCLDECGTRQGGVDKSKTWYQQYTINDTTYIVCGTIYIITLLSLPRWYIYL
jgi:hypothetical protein